MWQIIGCNINFVFKAKKREKKRNVKLNQIFFIVRDRFISFHDKSFFKVIYNSIKSNPVKRMLMNSL